MATTEPIKNTEQLRAMTEYFLERRQFRNNALLVLGVYTALRISDLFG